MPSVGGHTCSNGTVASHHENDEAFVVKRGAPSKCGT
ncbi:hypothetical protein A2U01_0113099, partial [Trifolium medium]|nr:hypothetical protein [Trifolium medium]